MTDKKNIVNFPLLSDKTDLSKIQKITIKARNKANKEAVLLEELFYECLEATMNLNLALSLAKYDSKVNVEVTAAFMKDVVRNALTETQQIFKDFAEEVEEK